MSESIMYRLSMLFSTKDRAGLLPVSRSTILRWVREGDFPKPYTIGRGCAVWDKCVVDQWLDSQRKGMHNQGDNAAQPSQSVNGPAKTQPQVKRARNFTPPAEIPSCAVRAEKPVFQPESDSHPAGIGSAQLGVSADDYSHYSREASEANRIAASIRRDSILRDSSYGLSQLASTKGRPGLLPVGPAAIWRWVREGRFPKPFTIGVRRAAWDKCAVDRWLADQRSRGRS